MQSIALFTLLLSVQLLCSCQAAVSSWKKSEWWRSEIIYQVYPRSFYDADGDGTGDVRGIIKKLDYIASIGAKSIWLSPIYTSPMADFGYDISNHTEIDPIFGTIDDFDELLRLVHEKDMHLIMDFVPNHTSNKHKWFEASRQNAAGAYSDYYIWVNCTQPQAPGARPGGVNNWLSFFGGPAWTFDPVRGQCYLHQFAPEQPDLNFRSAAVRAEVIEVLRFWLLRGVDGLRADAVRHMAEDPLLRDEPLAEGVDVHGLPEDQLPHSSLNHVHTADLEETYEIIQDWRAEIDSISESTGRKRLLMTEAYSPIDELMKYYTFRGKPLADFPFNFELLTASRTRGEFCDARCLREAAGRFLDSMPSGAWPNWVIGNHDNSRIATRFKPVGRFVKALNTLLLTLPGTPTCYYGDELGMRDVLLRPEQMVDPYGRRFPSESRDPARSPMLWDSSTPSAGFSKGQPWLPVEANFQTKTVAAQVRDKTSTLAAFKSVAKLRTQPEFLYGSVKFLLADDRFLVYSRQLKGDVYTIAMYIGKQTHRANLKLSANCNSRSMNFMFVVNYTVDNHASIVGGDAVVVAMEPGDFFVAWTGGCDTAATVVAAHHRDEL